MQCHLLAHTSSDTIWACVLMTVMAKPPLSSRRQPFHIVSYVLMHLTPFPPYGERCISAIFLCFAVVRLAEPHMLEGTHLRNGGNWVNQWNTAMSVNHPAYVINYVRLVLPVLGNLDEVGAPSLAALWHLVCGATIGYDYYTGNTTCLFRAL